MAARPRSEKSTRNRVHLRRKLAGALVAMSFVAAACSGTSEPGDSSAPTDSAESDVAGSDRGSDPVSGTLPVSPPRVIASDVDDRYEFSRLGMTAGGWVTGIVVHPEQADVMYARTDVGGAYRWNPVDGRWEQMITASSVKDRDAGGALYNVESVATAATDPDVVYLSVGNDADVDESTFSTDGRILRSTDGGRTWESSENRFFIAGNGKFRQQGERLAVDPLDPDVVFLGTRREGIWISTDGGDTFDNVDESMVSFGPADRTVTGDAGISFLSADPSGATTPDGRTARWYAGVAGVGVMRTDDGGSTWTNIMEVAPSVVPQEGDVAEGLLHVAFNDAAGGAGSVQRYSPDSGWTPFNVQSGASIQSLAVDPADARRVLISTEAVQTGRLNYSDNGGETWSNPVITTTAPDAPWIAVSNDGDYMPIGKLAFDPHDPGRVWFAEGIGVWTTVIRPDQAAWAFAGRGIEELVVADFVAASSGPTVSAVADFQGFAHVEPGETPARALVDGQFAGGTSLDYVGGSPDELVWIGAEYHRYFSPDRRSRAARSSDGGVTWTELPNLEQDMFGGNIAVSAGDPDNIVWLPSYYLSPFEYLDIPKGLFATTDGGDNWTRLPDVGGTNAFHRLMWWFGRQALTADKVEPNTFYLVDEEERFFVSTNGGTEWTEAPFAPPCSVDVACHVFGQLHADPVQGRRIWANVGEAGLYRTDDAGETAWTRIEGVDEVRSLGFGAPIGDSSVPALFIHGRVGGDEELGIWRSADAGDTWELIVREPYDSFAGINVVEGDMDVPGRVYVGFAGSGAVYGDDLTLTSS